MFVSDGWQQIVWKFMSKPLFPNICSRLEFFHPFELPLFFLTTDIQIIRLFIIMASAFQNV